MQLRDRWQAWLRLLCWGAFEASDGAIEQLVTRGILFEPAHHPNRVIHAREVLTRLERGGGQAGREGWTISAIARSGGSGLARMKRAKHTP